MTISETSSRELVVDRSRCIGAGECIIVAAEHFEQDDDGYVFVPSGPAAEVEEDDAVREAVQKCPSGALSWRT